METLLRGPTVSSDKEMVGHICGVFNNPMNDCVLSGDGLAEAEAGFQSGLQSAG